MKINSLNQIRKLLDIPVEEDFVVNGFSVDTRTLKEGNLFFALPGNNVDGHVFLEDAKKRGASAVVVESSFKGSDFGMPKLIVQDSLKALQDLCAALLSKRQTKIIAITGSVGKTTTKEFITTLLEEKFKVAKSPGNSNSQIGLPLSILNHTNGDEEFLVLEMGMNHQGQIKKLVEIAPPDISVLTQVSLTHAGNFNSLKEIAEEKAEIFKHFNTKIGVINRNIPYFEDVVQVMPSERVTYSINSKEADYYYNQSIVYRSNVDCFEINPNLHPHFGKHHYENLLSAIAVAFTLGLSKDEILRGVSRLALPEKRFEWIEKLGILFINDSYNATEISLIAALESLPAAKKDKKKIAVIGEMLELGKFSRECHERVGKKALECVDQLFLLGKDCEPIYECWKDNRKPVDWFLDPLELKKHLKLNLEAGDVVLLKGSCKNELWKILEEF